MKRRVRVLGRAESDLVEIAQYAARETPSVGPQVVDALLAAIERLATFPARGAVPRDARLSALGYRFLVVGPHLIFYKVLRRDVRVYRVVHGKRAYEDWL